MATKVNFLAGIDTLYEHLSVILAIKLRISRLSTTSLQRHSHMFSLLLMCLLCYDPSLVCIVAG
jgi:hypothetical protein